MIIIQNIQNNIHSLSSEKLLSIIDKAQIIIFIWKNAENWPVEYVSDNISIFGYSPDEFLSGKVKYSEIIHPIDLKRVEYDVKNYSENHIKEIQKEYRILTKERRIKWVHDRTTIRYDSNGNITHYEGIIIDISEKKKIIDDLKHNEEYFRKFCDEFPLPIAIADKEWNTEYINPKFTEVFGYTLDEVYNKESWLEKAYLDEIVREESIKTWNDNNKKKWQHPFEVTCKDGTIRTIIFIDLKQKEGKILTIFHDITEIKKTEKKIHDSEKKFRESEKKYHEIVSQANSIFLRINKHGVITYANEFAVDFFGFSEEELIGHPVTQTIVPPIESTSRNLIKMMDEILSKTEDYRLNINENIKKNGERVWCSWSNKVIYNEKGENNGILSIGIDITALRNAQIALQESEEKYIKIFQNSTDGIILHKKNSEIIDVNKKIVELLGYSKEEMLSMNSNDLLFKKITKQSFNLEELPPRFERRLKKKDGNPIDVEVSASYIEIGKEKIIQAFIRDITKRKEEEEERLRSQKIESISLLAGGIAHDFNNFLVGILGNINLLQFNENFDPDIKETLKELEIATIHASNLTKQLLTFSKGGNPIKKTQSIIEIIQNSISFVMHGSKSKCELNVEGISPNVEVDAAQMNQVFNNLIINANQAMPNGGIITIDVSVLFIKNRTDIPLPNGKYIQISITDQGLGIPEKHKNQIFNPYFTTKPSGTGLGLATCYSIIKKHNGHITFASTPGICTTFTIFLPISEKLTQTPILGKKVHKDDFSGNILIMDDEPMVQNILRQMLNRLGFNVEITNSGTEAVTLYQKALNNEKFLFVIMDLTIPGGMGGKETIKILQNIDPNVKAIVSSGYSNDPIMSNYKDYGFIGVLDKPFTFAQFKELVYNLMTS